MTRHHSAVQSILPKFALIALIGATMSGCALGTLLKYKAFPDYPKFEQNQQFDLDGLTAEVSVRQKTDGLYYIEGQNDNDVARVGGYLQARDRMFQMDILRHLAQGRLSELVGNVKLGAKTALELDIYNRHLGLWDQAKLMEQAIDPKEREMVQAAADGINAWIAEGHTSLEHRLIGTKEIRPWTIVDSLSILRLFMFNLTHNYTRELRRLVMACAVGVDAMDLIWPTNIEFDIHFLPDEALGSQSFTMPAAIAPELAAMLPDLCPATASSDDGNTENDSFDPSMGQIKTQEVLLAMEQLSSGLEASNNWVIGGKRTASGKPILANDAHLAHLNPPIVWSMHVKTPEWEAQGITLVGLHRVVFGTNGKVAWGGTINNVDMQDLMVHAPSTDTTVDATTHYRYGDTVSAYEIRTSTFAIKGGETQEVKVRYSNHGPILNDMDPYLRDRIPLTALKSIDFNDIGDVRAARDITYAKDVKDWSDKMSAFDSACINWVFADTNGGIGWSTPCRVPVREGWLGTFPAPGWDPAYNWKGYYAKDEFVPPVLNPEIGYIGTANNRPIPSTSRRTPYNNDPSSPNRYRQIKRGIEAMDKATIADSEALQMNVEFGYFEDVLATIPQWCDNAEAASAKEAVCQWDRVADSDSIATSIVVYMTNALVDQTMGVRLPGGSNGKLWHFVQNIPHFEQNVDWLLLRDVTDTIWDDPTSKSVEDKNAAFDRALATGVATLTDRFGDDMADWEWGTIRPFQLKHIFGDKGALSSLVNEPEMPGRGLPNTVFKNQFNRANRDTMHVTAGPAFRINIDMSEPLGGNYMLAGGQSGWPKATYYGNHTRDWLEGHGRPLSSAGGVTVKFKPKQ